MDGAKSVTQTEHDGGLLRRWLTLAGELGIGGAAARPIFNALQAHYQDDGRYYHNLAHVRQVLETVERLAPYAEALPAVKLAAWFHDAIYEPGADDNEARSARYLRATFEPLAAPEDMVEEAARLIRLTEGHEAADRDGNGRVLLDADLAILGAELAAYERYAQAIRQEFAHIPEEAYRRGRAAVLRRILQREPLYYTRPIQEEREARARRNMRWELAILDDS